MSASCLVTFLLHTASPFYDDPDYCDSHCFPRDPKTNIPYVSSEHVRDVLYSAIRDKISKKEINDIEFSTAEILLYPVNYDSAAFAYITSTRQLKKVAELSGNDALGRLATLLGKIENGEPPVAFHGYIPGTLGIGTYRKCGTWKNPNMMVFAEWMSALLGKIYPEYKMLQQKAIRDFFFVRDSEFSELLEESLISVIYMSNDECKRTKNEDNWDIHEMFPDFTLLVARMRSENRSILQKIATFANRKLVTVKTCNSSQYGMQDIGILEMSELPPVDTSRLTDRDILALPFGLDLKKSRK